MTNHRRGDPDPQLDMRCEYGGGTEGHDRFTHDPFVGNPNFVDPGRIGSNDGIDEFTDRRTGE